ncbi:polysialyltransferase family glycosyltransferase [Streptomyces sp. H10-C2]|uniref:polysialyltransferase family glycosyltransferase n=1 Tax=unclassified Streptomyces TaxID=2593676 RepID=UPI0024BA11A4|nr:MULTISPECIES: polysialyltransferase family glycosyltransferase [unclassified Streptomyces]MDJ0340508.1 polysialyltransferase family glycosyltransferase [Streptomyces sp. PH10-H1]MDJ0370156.1 polysialyltransferase family glycosyltransferase [Streptomyces sp. H10-C2]
MARAHTQIYVASTLYGAATLAAALDAGLFAPADRRLLLISNNAPVPETTPAVDAAPGFGALRARFDDVLSWNEAISPMHPSDWAPRPDDVPMWERHLRMLWELGDDDLELVVESIQVKPALALVKLFPAATIDVYADGLMSYGPTRDKIEPLVTTRINRLLHLDLVAGLRPLLLTEYGVEPHIVPAAEFTKVLAELADASGDLGGGAGVGSAAGDDAAAAAALPEGAALLLGQYLSALGILTPAEEEELHLRMLRGAAALGHRRIIFKPHPVAPAHWSDPLEREAAALGVELTVLDSPVLAEVLYQRVRPALVVGCYSTALLTAAVLYGIPVARTGTEMLLERLSPYQNSNRVPVTIVDDLLPDLDDAEAVRSWSPPLPERVAGDLTPLLRAVGFCMQAQLYPELREETVGYLSKRLNARTWRYFKRRRLASLALPGAVPSQLAFLPRNPLLRRVARRARALKKAAIG